ncbi:MAG: N-acetyl-gamma-glutamyl-phosphate reductase [Planctomycetes bacterium]|nr:N-acetyl-gamma-glutamyl-phosphate reductase [Planctomycetota bacterium]
MTPSTPPVRVAVVGSAGYVGGELLRLLLGHPQVRVVRAASRSHAGQRLDRVHRHLRGATDLTFTADGPAEAADDADVVFLALTHKESLAAVEGLRARLDAPGAPLVIDMAGSFRLGDPARYGEAYAHEHSAPDLLPRFVYALPELAGDLRGARLISSPGCFATAAALAAAPLARSGRVRGTIVLNGVTGASGSGAQPKDTTHFPMRDGNLKAYRVLSHQHEPEVQQTVDRYAATGSCARARPGEVSAAPLHPVLLTTHSAPITRGIYMTAAAELASADDGPAVLDEVRRAYEGARFVRLLDEPPELKGLAGTNFADLHVAARGRHVVVTCAIDNLMKGAAGQGVQAMNLALGLEEGAGLGFLGLTP